jgi:serine/threonine protein kinase
MKIPDTNPWVSTGKSLGSGGQAEVYLVTRRDQADGQKYALKVLKHADSKQARERFAQEIEAVKLLNSPYIAKIVDHSKPEDPFQYYTMEYYEGAITLASVIFSDTNPFHGNALKCLDLFENLILCIQACEHAKPTIVHRDITPKNILALPDGTFRLIDFGICLIQDGQRVTLVDEDVGTRNYTAPECEAGNDSAIGTHSDLYSAAKVLWSCITSQRAFAREQPVFGNRGLDAILPRLPSTWHLNLIFEKTIRANFQDRFVATLQVIDLIQEVRYLVQRGFPPLREIAKRCPACGHAEISALLPGQAIFGDRLSPDMETCFCKHCGFVFVRDIDRLRHNYQSFLDSK